MSPAKKKPAPLVPRSSTEASSILSSMGDADQVRIATRGRAGTQATILSCTGLRGYEYSPADQTLVAATGERIGDIQRMLAEHGQRISQYPFASASEDMTLGALLGSGADAPSSQRYGRLRESVIGAEFVLSDGTRAHSGGRVIKNVAGYDLAKLMVGSMGALAFVTAVSLRLYPAPRRCSRVGMKLGLGDSVSLVAGANRLGIEMATCEWGGGRLEIGLEGPEQAVAASTDKVTALAKEHGAAGVEMNHDQDYANSLARALAADRQDADKTTIKLGTRLFGVVPLQDALDAGGFLERGVSLSSHLGLGVHYLGLPCSNDLLGELDILLAGLGVAGQLVDTPGDWDRGIFAGRRPGGLGVMRRLLESMDPPGRWLSPMRTSVFEETEKSA